MPEVTLKELSDAAPPGPWALSPQELDDWGMVRAAFNPATGFRPVVCSIRSHDDEAEQAAARQEGRQPKSVQARADFIIALERAYRAGHLHDDTALATAVARARREALEEADNREVERILGLSDAEVSAEIEAEGRDPEALAEAMRGQMNATFRLCEEIKTLRDVLAGLVRHVHAGRYRCSLSGLKLNGNIPAFHLAERALAVTPPEARQTETGWKPISEAPKDKTSVIVAVPSLHAGQPMIVGEAYFDPEHDGWWWAGQNWGDYYASPITETNAPPALWQPMPSPPPPAIGNLEGESRS